MSRSPRRTGFSLVELVVTMALVGILVGLVLPAAQHARAAADRLACQDHLRHIGLALAMYHDATGSFPPGLSVTADRYRYQFLGWGPRLTPFLERDSLRKRIEQAFAEDPNQADFHGFAAHRQLLGTPVWLFACPSDLRAPGPALRGSNLVAFTSYLGVEGTNQFTHDGLLYLDSRHRLTDVADGTSNTLLVGERPPSADLNFGWWYRGWGQRKEGSGEMLLGAREFNTTGLRYRCSPGPYDFAPGQNSNQCDMFHFWSLHAGGAFFLFADGTVRFLSYSAAPILPALATRSGGETYAARE